MIFFRETRIENAKSRKTEKLQKSRVTSRPSRTAKLKASADAEQSLIDSLKKNQKGRRKRK